MNGNTLRTGKCRHCGKPKEEHFGLGTLKHEWCEEMQYDGATFYDSGLAALDAHKEELYLAVDEYFELNGTDRRLRIIEILDKIKKESK